MPKLVDWADDDLPRWERRHRPQRVRLPHPLRDRLPDRRPVMLVLARAEPPSPPSPPGRRPLHLIWGEPQRADEPPLPPR